MPLIIQGLSVGKHTVLVQIADTAHNVRESKTVEFYVPVQNATDHHAS